MSKVQRILRCEALLTGKGTWLAPAFVALDAGGVVLSVDAAAPSSEDAGEPPVERLAGYVVPGFQNAHSHAFQYAMVGLAEHLPAGAATDDFWSWREAMYGL